jgi:3-hydroxyisobutyrate dehydrogenase
MGETVKLVNNLIAAINMAGVAEAFNLGVQAGVAPEVLYDVVSKSSGDCWVLRTRVPYPNVIPAAPANDDFAPGFMVNLMLKDVGLAVAAAEGLNASAPLAHAAEQVYRSASEQGHGRKDFSAVAKLYGEEAPPAS